MQSGKGVAIRPTKSQVGGFLPILLGALGSALLGKLLGGKGMQFPSVKRKGMKFPIEPYVLPYVLPFFYHHNQFDNFL